MLETHVEGSAVIRKAAVAGTWYPGSKARLEAAVDALLAAADRRTPMPATSGGADLADIVAFVAPHAGLMYSGGVAAHAYRLLRNRPIDVSVLVGPSHFVGFEGVSVYRGRGFDTPLGLAAIDDELTAALVAATPVVSDRPDAHEREHSLELQLPFLKRLVPEAAIVPLLMGHQRRETCRALGEALGRVLAGRNGLLIASTDLSHYYDASTAASLDRVVIDHIARFDVEGLQDALERRPEHACGGGPLVAVMRAAALLGARDGLVLDYADSGDVSGDKTSVVGYLAAALGTFRTHVPRP
jgi:AmmeMemoRadiSam system protein B